MDTLTAFRLVPGARQHLDILGGVKGVLKPVSQPVLLKSQHLTHS